MDKVINLNFCIHIPYLLKNHKIFDISHDFKGNFFEEEKTLEMMKTLGEKYFLKINKTLSDLAKIHKGEFKFSVSISGISLEILDKCSKKMPEILNSFKTLSKNKNIQINSTLYYSKNKLNLKNKEILNQTKKQKKICEKVLEISPIGFIKKEPKIITFNKLVENFPKYLEKTAKLSLNIDYLSLTQEYEKKQFINFLKYFPTKTLAKGFTFEFFETKRRLEEKNTKTSFENPLQENFLSEITKLGEKIIKSKNKILLNDFKRLLDSHQCENLELKFFSKNPLNLFTNHSNSFDHYINLKNILETLEVKTEKILLNQNPCLDIN